MSTVIQHINPQITKAVQQGSDYRGKGVDMPDVPEIEIRSFRFLAMESQRNRAGKPTTDFLKTEDGAVDMRSGYYVPYKLEDGVNVYYGRIYKLAPDYTLVGEGNNNFLAGHIRKIKGEWKFRAGHDCRQYSGKNETHPCNLCGANVSIWKD